MSYKVFKFRDRFISLVNADNAVQKTMDDYVGSWYELKKAFYGITCAIQYELDQATDEDRKWGIDYLKQQGYEPSDWTKRTYKRNAKAK